MIDAKRSDGELATVVAFRLHFFSFSLLTHRFKENVV